jgi:hypothetical protein
MKLGEIFVPGRLPGVTYVPRDELRLEALMGDYLEERGRILSLSGPTKSGKTVLVRKVVPRAVEIPGGDIKTADAFWNAVIDHFGASSDAYSEVSKTIETGEGRSVTAEVGGKLRVPVAEVGGNLAATGEETRTRAHSIRRQRPVHLVAKNLLRGRADDVLFIDDFHYIPQDAQLEIVRGLKPLIFDGLRVIIASVPHRAFDAVRVEKEMTGRVEQLAIPLWKDNELEGIAERGFNELNVDALDADVARLAEEAYASPHLMQEFCLQFCKWNDVRKTVPEPIRLKTPDWKSFFRERAPSASKSAFDLLAKGPPRTDRKVRRLRTGAATDIYGAILAAIAHTGPATSISYDQLRPALRDVLAEDEEPPQLHEITSVLVQMSKIARDKIQGEAVVDFDEEYRTIHISDPFFAFFLRWGLDSEVDAPSRSNAQQLTI